MSGEFLLLYLMIIPADQRGTGLGTRVMQHLVLAADQRGVGMTLSPSDALGADLDRLQDFYRRFGFITNTWHGVFCGSAEGMVRVPRNSVTATADPACTGNCCNDDQAVPATSEDTARPEISS
ncbi:GNAT family N-acetyltransferase [Streptomyces sp. SGAir0957]